MPRIVVLIWFWSLPMLPFTAMLTFILTLVICNQLPHRSSAKLPNISILGTGSAYSYFVAGFVILVPQFLLLLIGRLQFLLQSQSIIHRVILYIIHSIALVSAVFLLIMAIVSVDDRPYLHVIGAFGMFGCLSTYCFLHTIVVFYLFIQRLKAPQHSNILWSIWFLFCSILLIIFLSIWASNGQSIPQYIAAAMPFLYIIGFLPQFWRQAKMKRQDAVLSAQVYYSNETKL